MKKLFALCLTVVLLIAMMPVVGVSAADVVTFSAGSVTGAPGEEVSVPVSIDTNPGLTFAQVKVEYDATVLEVVDIETLAFAGGTVECGPTDRNPLMITWYDCLENITETGAIANIIFKIKDDAVEGTYDLVVAGSEGNIIDVDLNDVPFTNVNGSVIVAAAECTHTETVVEGAVDATCTAEGSTGTTKCAECGEVIKEAEVIEKLAHTYGDWVTTKEPTATETGLKEKECSVCGDKVTEEIPVIDVPPVDEDAVTFSVGKVTGAPGEEVSVPVSIDTNPGITFASLEIEYDATVLEVVKIETLIFAGKATSSGPATANPLKITWYDGEVDTTETGAIANVIFKIKDDAAEGTYNFAVVGKQVLNANFANVPFATVNGSVTVATVVECAHTETVVEGAVDATCTAEGSTGTTKCAECGEVIKEAEVIEKLAHTAADAVEENRVEATCKAAGSYESVVYCSVCGEELSRETVAIEKLAHTATDAVEENRVDATCKAEGSYESVVYCSVCGEEISRETVVIEKLAHTWVEKVADEYLVSEATTTSKAIYKKSCSVCGQAHDTETFEYGELVPSYTEGWKHDGTGWTWINADGSILKDNWVLDGGKWYFMDADGYMVSNQWRKDSIGWVYLGSDGAMLTNAWCTDSQGWCYVGADGYAVTNCWKQDSIGWIWLNSNGSMTKDQWILDGGKWYYLDANGYMASNQWRKDSIGWVYLGSDGAMLTNAWCTDSQGWCYVGADGYAVTNCWKQDSVGWIWLNANGSMTKNAWVLDGGNWYYLDANGYMLYSTSQNIGGVVYNFNASGVCTNP